MRPQSDRPLLRDRTILHTDSAKAIYLFTLWHLFSYVIIGIEAYKISGPVHWGAPGSLQQAFENHQDFQDECIICFCGYYYFTYSFFL